MSNDNNGGSDRWITVHFDEDDSDFPEPGPEYEFTLLKTVEGVVWECGYFNHDDWQGWGWIAIGKFPFRD